MIASACAALASVVAVLAPLSVLSVATALPASAASGVAVTARIDDQGVGGGRIRLDPELRTRVSIEVRNQRSEPVHVASVRLSGSALGLTFFAYDTAMSLDVPAGESASQSFDVDLSDLGAQATGLMPIEVVTRDDRRAVLATSYGTGDVHGSLLSVFGLFGLFLAGVTALSTAAALIALARQRLPVNRWRRALRFLPAGIGVGLTAVVTLSALRVTAPVTQAEVPLVVVTGAIGFLLGYLTPRPDDEPADGTPPAGSAPAAPAPAPGMFGQATSPSASGRGTP